MLLLEKLFPEGEQGVCDGGHGATLGRLDVLPEGPEPQVGHVPVLTSGSAWRMG